MNTIATMSASTYRAAVACMAVKDVRYYLNGIYLDLEADKVVSTDGSMLYVNGIRPGDAPEVNTGELTGLIFEPVKIPASATDVKVCGHDDHNVMLHVSFSRTPDALHVCRIIDGKYPAWEVITPKGDPAAFESLTFNVKHLAVLKQVFKNTAHFEMPGGVAFGPVLVTGANGEGTVVLMPVRLKTRQEPV